MKKINLDEIIENSFKKYNFNLVNWAPAVCKDAMKEACKQTLELAAENATINSVEYAKYQGKIIRKEDLGQEVSTENPQVYLSCNKQSILDTSNQIE